MLVAEAISGLKHKYTLAYANYLLGVQGAFQDALINPTYFQSTSMTDFDVKVTTLQYQLEMMLMTLDKDCKSLANIAPYKPQTQSQIATINQFIGLLSDDVKANIMSQAKRDARQFRQVAVETLMGLSVTTSKKDPIAFQKQISSLAQKRLIFLAKNGSRWKSERYIGVSLNWLLHKVYNEAFLYLSKQSAFGAVSQTKNQSIRFNRKDYLNEDFKSKYFHPNSDWLVID